MSSLGPLSDSQPHHTHQQPNGFIAKPEHIPNGGSHDIHKTEPNNLGSGSESPDREPSSYNMAIFHEPLMTEDHFYNFGESIIDPSKSFLDGNVSTEFLAPGDQKFDPELFDSILSSGDDILAQLEKNSGPLTVSEGVASFGLNVGGGEEDEDDRAESNTPTNASRPLQVGDSFEDLVRLRALSTITEDQGEALESPHQECIIDLDTILPSPMMHPHPLEPHLLPSKLHLFSSVSDPFKQAEVSDCVTAESDLGVADAEQEELSLTPQRTSNAKSPSNEFPEALASVIEGGSGGTRRKEEDEDVINQLYEPHPPGQSPNTSLGPTALVISPPPEEAEGETTTSNTNPTSDSSSNLALDDKNLIGSHEDVARDQSAAGLPTTSGNACLLESCMDSGVRRSPSPLLSPNTNDDRNRQLHTTGEGSPVARSNTPQTPVHRPSPEFAVLQPLSPDHGLELNEQYEFLRRTLSHSQRRFSQRGRRPRERKGYLQRGQVDSQAALGESRLVHSLASPVATRRGENLSKGVRQRQAIGQLKSIMLESENQASNTLPPQQGAGALEEHVDQHGRTYYMDHVTRTIAFDSSGSRHRAPEQQDIQSRREMLDRRYQNLQRSFRRSERSNVHVRNRSLFSNVRGRRVSGERNGSDLAAPGNDNNSLSLSLAEAEAMARGMASQGRKKQRSKSTMGKWFTRKSSKTTRVTQQGAGLSGDDIISISPTSSSIEGSPQPENVSDSPSRSSGSDSSSRNRNENGESTVAILEAVRSPSRGSFERDLTPISIQSIEFESGTDDDPTTPQTSPPSDLEVVIEPAQPDGGEASGDAEFTSRSGLRGRQTSIVHASNLTESDESAAARAREVASNKRRLRLSSDELTDVIGGGREGEQEDTTMVNVEREHLSSFTSNQSTTDSVGSGPPEISAPDGPEVKKKRRKTKSGVSRGSMRKSKRSAKSLSTSPALRFIVRKDLYTFLNSAGTAGEDFFANRSLMELVQRIRANNSLFQKYEHSHHLVEALNMFSDVRADLPNGWEKKLNKQGREFFIDHEYELTTFIDPRLPFPDTPYTYVDRSTEMEIVARQNSVPPAIRPHHVTIGAPSLFTPENIGSEQPGITSQTSPILLEPIPGNMLDPSQPATTQDSSNRLSVISTASSVSVVPISYEEQVVAFFSQPTVTDLITQRYSRGVRPPLQSMIDAIRMNGTMALERIQMSGSVAAYELALVLSLFEEEISQMNSSSLTPAAEAPPTSDTPPFTSPEHTSDATSKKTTLQRRKEAFPTKLQNFKMMMARIGFVQGSRIRYNIRRGHMLEDAYEHIMKTNVKLLQKKRLNITFRGEEGLDYGGPSREFFFLLSREIFNPYYGLFEYSANDTYTIQISSTAAFIQNNMEWFRFAGRVVALVIVQGFLLDVFFTRTVYKSLLCRPPYLKDLEALEPDFYNSLLWICDNDPEPLDLTFTVEEEAFGQLNTHELKPGGTDIPVTEDNKEEYVGLMLRWRLERGVVQPMEAFKKGFSEVLPIHLLINFDAQELEFLTAGTLEIDLDDWKSNTEYRNGYHALHQVVQWFWKMVESFDNEERLRLLQFVTGTSSVPIAGFKALRGSNGPKKFTIDYYNDVQAFPRSHTCFNRVDLPPYPSYDILYQKMHYAIIEGGGFGME